MINNLNTKVNIMSTWGGESSKVTNNTNMALMSYNS